MNNENCFAYYCVVGFECEPEHITSLIGLNPTEMARVGDPSPAPSIPVKENYWMLETRLSKTDVLEVETHVIDVLNQLEPVTAAVKNINSRYYAKMQIVSCWYGSNLSFGLSKETIQRINDLALDIDCDLYSLGDD